MKKEIRRVSRLGVAGVLLLIAAGFAPKPEAKAAFSQLRYNASWYRSYDSTSFIKIEDGELLFAWELSDPDSVADSFYIGIDTLWALPQDVLSDTVNDWDLQVCPNEFCIQGLKAGVHGGDAFFPFGDTVFRAEHHYQFYPAIGPDYRAVAPLGAILGGYMYARSRTTGAADTVLGFGAWKMAWDSASPPPLRPVRGYLPKRSDFTLDNGRVKYTGPIGIEKEKTRSAFFKPRLSPSPFRSTLSIEGLANAVEVRIYNAGGREVFRRSGRSAVTWRSEGAPAGVYIVEILSAKGRQAAKAIKLR